MYFVELWYDGEWLLDQRLEGVGVERRCLVNATPNQPEGQRPVYAFDAIPEDEATQEEPNRRLRKPGEPGYCPPSEKAVPAETARPGVRAPTPTE